MSGSTITHFEQDPERLAVLAECMENYDVGEPGAEWPNNMISRRAVVYGSGRIAPAGDVVSHAVNTDELDRCRRLSQEAAALMDGVNVDMGSESADPFQPFFIAANVDETVPTRIDESLIRAKFGDTIFPLATITVEPLEEQGTWWSELVTCGDEGEELEQYLAPWRTMMSWFHQQSELAQPVFVRIGDTESLWQIPKQDYPAGTEVTPCVLPRLVLALTRNGSLVGLFGFSVQT
jgi:hypothetical protein